MRVGTQICEILQVSESGDMATCILPPGVGGSVAVIPSSVVSVALYYVFVRQYDVLICVCVGASYLELFVEC